MNHALFITESDVDLACHLFLADRAAEFVTPVFILKTPEYVDIVLAAGYAAFTYRELYDRFLSTSYGSHSIASEIDLTYERFLLDIVGWHRYADVFGTWMFSKRPPTSRRDSVEHLKLQAGLLEAALTAFCDEIKPVFASVWNGLFLPTSAVASCLERSGIPHHFCEEGFFPGTMAIDPCGVNFAGELAKKGHFDPPTPDVAGALASFIESYRKSKTSRAATETNALPDVQPGQKVFFFPAQIDTDTNVVLASRAFPTNESVVSALQNVVAQIPNGYLVVKTHPRDPESLRHLERYRDERTLITDSGNIHDWIAASLVIVTRNSTVGLEALTYRKPVVTLGDSIYSGHGFTIDVREPAALVGAMFSALEMTEISADMSDQFNGFLSELLIGHTLWLKESPLSSMNCFIDGLRRIPAISPQDRRLPWLENRMAESEAFCRRISDGDLFLRSLSLNEKAVSVVIVDYTDRGDCATVVDWLQRLLPNMRLAESGPATSARGHAWRVLRAVVSGYDLMVLVTPVVPRRIPLKIRLLALFFPGRTLLVDKRLKVVKVQ